MYTKVEGKLTRSDNAARHECKVLGNFSKKKKKRQQQQQGKEFLLIFHHVLKSQHLPGYAHVRLLALKHYGSLAQWLVSGPFSHRARVAAVGQVGLA